MSGIRIYKNQSGIVSIIVAIVLLTIITLIGTSFALLSRREQRQVLDRQLSTQAFYAAESGVNDAVQAVKGGLTNATNCSDINNLNPEGPNLNLGSKLAYTCVLVNNKPTSLEFAPITTDSSKIIKIQAGQTIGRVRISWEDNEGGSNFANSTISDFLLPQKSYNENNPDSFANSVGILQATLIPIKSTISRSDLISGSQTVFLYPKGASAAGGVGIVPYSSDNQGKFVNAQCNSGNRSVDFPRHCNVDINSLFSASTGTYYLRLKSIYRNSRVTVQAFAPGSSTPLSLTNSQVVIDSTGKANDVLRRIQVRVPIGTEYDIPEAALETTDDICKKISRSTTQTFDNCL